METQQTRTATWWTWDEKLEKPKQVTRPVSIVQGCSEHAKYEYCVRLGDGWWTCSPPYGFQVEGL